MSEPVKLYILGDNVSTDQIHPPHYFSLDVEHMKKGFLRGVSEEWADTIEPGAIIVGGDNLGCGSSRELTARVFKERGVKLVLARSFARIFFRNLVNLGIMACQLESDCPWPTGAVVTASHDPAARRLAAGDKQLTYRVPSPFVQRLVGVGGLIPLLDDLFPHE